MRPGLQTGDGFVARGAGECPERNACDIHTVRPNESQPSVVDAYDHEIQVFATLIIPL